MLTAFYFCFFHGGLISITCYAQIAGDSEASKSLLAESEGGDNLRTTARKGKHPRSRAQSDAESDLEISKYKHRFGSVGHGSVGNGSKPSVGRPNSAMSEPAFTYKKRRQLIKQQSLANSEPQTENSANDRIRTQKISIQSLEREKHGRSKTSISPDGNTAVGSVHSEGSPSTRQPAPSVEDNSENDLQPVGWQRWRISQLLLSRYAGPAVLLLAGQVLAVVVILLAADLITYNAMIQLTSIDSMISHIGVYASVVNSYLTTHAFALSQTSQNSLANEFNLHLHHIAKVKAIFESDMVSKSAQLDFYLECKRELFFIFKYMYLANI